MRSWAGPASDAVALGVGVVGAGLDIACCVACGAAGVVRGGSWAPPDAAGEVAAEEAGATAEAAVVCAEGAGDVFAGIAAMGATPLWFSSTS